MFTIIIFFNFTEISKTYEKVYALFYGLLYGCFIDYILRQSALRLSWKRSNQQTLQKLDFNMGWELLSTMTEWDAILKHSFAKAQVVFKHSTRCSISQVAKSRIEKHLTEQDSFYLLDLLQYREISNVIAIDLRVTHESPQVLVIRNGACCYHTSHSAIDYDDIIAAIQKA
jgi:bacillithiol system protein YtxJ